MRKKTFRKVIAVVAMIAVLFVMAGCGARTTGGDTPGPVQDTTAYPVELTYVSLAYLDSGDESIDKFVDDVDQIVNIENMESKEAMLSAAIYETINLLKVVPDNISDKAVTCVSDHVPVNAVTVLQSGPNGSVEVDIDGAAMDMDSYTEKFFIYQIADTILDSFEEIENVSFTVDGVKVDGLNHMDLSKPFTEDMVDRFEGDN